jgi:hypothetical protein
LVRNVHSPGMRPPRVDLQSRAGTGSKFRAPHFLHSGAGLDNSKYPPASSPPLTRAGPIDESTGSLSRTDSMAAQTSSSVVTSDSTALRTPRSPTCVSVPSAPSGRSAPAAGRRSWPGIRWAESRARRAPDARQRSGGCSYCTGPGGSPMPMRRQLQENLYM